MPTRSSSKAAEFRQQAECIRTIARQVSLNEPRNRLLDSAELLEGLAEEEERKAEYVASRLEPGRDA